MDIEKIDWKFFVFCVVFGIVLDGCSRSFAGKDIVLYKPDIENLFIHIRSTIDPLGVKIDEAVANIHENELGNLSKGGELHIFEGDLNLTQVEINDMLVEVNSKNSVVFNLYNDTYRKDANGEHLIKSEEIKNYTMAARGIDLRHYLTHDFLEGFKPFDVENVFLPLSILARRKRYELDSDQYANQGDIWQNSRQAFYYPRGDCEDHAMALADWLIEMGEDARVVLGSVRSGGGHAWVVLYKNGEEFLLEATRKNGLSRLQQYPLAKTQSDYNPDYMFNRDVFWENVNRGDTATHKNANWVKKSEYLYK